MSAGIVRVRVAGGRVAVRLRRRSLLVAAALSVLALLLALLGLATGEFDLPLGEVVQALIGRGDPGTAFIVERLRLPRVVLALLVGGAFGASGAIFQSLTGNPLGSPDVIGFTYGSATGGLIAITVLHVDALGIALCAVAGGVTTALVVYGLAYRRGVQAFRLVLVGLGVGYTVLSVNWYLLTQATLSDAYTAQRWLVGSLNGADWPTVRVLAIALLLLGPAVVAIARPLGAMEVGDDASRALGIPVERDRAGIALLGVLLAAVATAATGPIAFVALAAPQIARRLTGAAGPGIAVSAITGAAILVASDLVAQRVLPTDLPVGLVTGFIGGTYLVWLLTRRKAIG